MCTITMTNKADKQVRKLNPSDRTRITEWIAKYIKDDPKEHGKPMTGNMSGFWTYRVGKYRMLARVDDGIVTLTNIALRKEAYPHHHC
jgi:mRNA interferase RelE/StbE